jgi:hypothetical protein
MAQATRCDDTDDQADDRQDDQQFNEGSNRPRVSGDYRFPALPSEQLRHGTCSVMFNRPALAAIVNAPMTGFYMIDRGGKSQWCRLQRAARAKDGGGRSPERDRQNSLLTGNFSILSPCSAILAPNRRANSIACRKIPYAMEQGIFFGTTGNFRGGTGNSTWTSSLTVRDFRH